MGGNVSTGGLANRKPIDATKFDQQYDSSDPLNVKWEGKEVHHVKGKDVMENSVNNLFGLHDPLPTKKSCSISYEPSYNTWLSEVILELQAYRGPEDLEYPLHVPDDVEPEEVTRYKSLSLFDPHDSELHSFDAILQRTKDRVIPVPITTATSLYYSCLTLEAAQREFPLLQQLYEAQAIDADTLVERLTFILQFLDNRTEVQPTVLTAAQIPSSQYSIDILGQPAVKNNQHLIDFNVNSNDKIIVRKSDPSLKGGSNNKRPKSIKVFVSSTFQDFQVEREYFTKFLFPKLIQERIVKERDVTISIIDLRWGITTEQSASGDVISICLSEIDRCRPFFIGLLGERYGWSQPIAPTDGSTNVAVDSLLNLTFTKGQKDFPWIDQFSDRSITELEIRHGVLNDPNSDIMDHALFYYRDKDSQIGRNVNTISGQQTDERMIQLKNEIRLVMGESKVKEYDSLEAVGSMITEDLLSIIERDYEPNPVPTSEIERERGEHMAFVDTRTKLYIGRQSYFDSITHYVSSKNSGSKEADSELNVPLLIAGESGVGKSALCCNWAEDYKERQRDKLIIEHYIGCSPKSTDLTNLLTRVMNEIADFYRNQTQFPALPNDLAGLIAKFPEYLSNSSQYGGAVIVLDALDQLTSSSESSLDWIPNCLPENVKIITSTTTYGQIFNAVTSKTTPWKKMNLGRLSKHELNTFIYEYLQVLHGKTLNEEQITRISQNANTNLPLFLRVLLDEVRLIGSYEKLNERLRNYLSAPSIPLLFDLVFERLENDMAEQKVDKAIIGQVLSRIWVSRRGVTEHELLGMLRDQMPPVVWARIHTQLSGMLIDSGSGEGGFLNFFHDYMRQGVQKRYLYNVEKRIEYRAKMIAYFEDVGGVHQVPMQRKVEEVPYQRLMNSDWNALERTLLDMSPNGYFLNLANSPALGISARYDLYKYWRECVQHKPEIQTNLLSSIRSLATNDDTTQQDTNLLLHHDRVLKEVGKFLEDVACYDSAEIVYNLSLEMVVDCSDNDPVVDKIIKSNSLANLLRMKGKFPQAKQHYAASASLCSRLSQNSPAIDKLKADTYDAQATVYRACGEYELAQPLYIQAMNIRRAMYGAIHVDIASSLNNLACLYHELGKMDDAELNFKQAIAIRETLMGSNHPDVAKNCQDLGSLYLDQSKFDAAKPLYEKAGRIYQAIFGREHPKYAENLNLRASLEQEFGHFPQSQELYQESLSIKRRVLGAVHPQIALTLNDMAVLLTRQDRYAEAEPLYREALKIREHCVGKAHPDYAQSLNNLGSLLQDMQNYTTALEFFKEALSINITAFGEEHMNVANTCNNLAGVYQYLNRPEQCVDLYKKALGIYARLLGENHADVAVTLNDLAVLYFRSGNNEKAVKYYKRALGIYESLFGEFHQDVAQALVNIGEVYKKQGNDSEAQKQWEKARLIYVTVFGASHSRTSHVDRLLECAKIN